MPKGGFGGLVARDDLWKPLIAAVNGVALGGGLELALACDVIIAAEHARLGLPEPRVGLMAAAGGVHRLPRHVPLKVAMGMILTGRPVSAAEAARIGLVNEVVPATQLMPRTRELAETICANGPMAVRMTKELALRSRDLSVPDGIRLYQALNRLIELSSDLEEGTRAFAEKRAPSFRNR